MRLDPSALTRSFLEAQRGRKSRHSIEDRVRPSRFQYDYLTLHELSRGITDLLDQLPRLDAPGRAVDIGSGRCPYGALLERKGYRVETLDVDPTTGADHIGTAEATGLPSASVDLVLCTQVLEHVRDPFGVMAEMRRILRPGGALVASAPHIWFFHPHPEDNWRFTQQGVVTMCERHGLRLDTLLAQGGSLLTMVQLVNITLYGVLGRAGAPIYALFNLAGRPLDRLLRNELLCHNFAWLAFRPDADGEAAER